MAEAAERVRADLGTIHVLFNNAGIVRGNGYFWEPPSRDFLLTMEVNSVGPMLVAREFLPAMIDSGSDCRLVNIASSAGLNAIPGWPPMRPPSGRPSVSPTRFGSNSSRPDTTG